MFPLYWIAFHNVMKMYRIGVLFPLENDLSASFSYRIGFHNATVLKVIRYVSDSYFECFHSVFFYRSIERTVKTFEIAIRYQEDGVLNVNWNIKFEF